MREVEVPADGVPGALPRQGLVTTAGSAPAGIGETGCCFHCGLPLPGVEAMSVRVDGVERPMCCPGCAAVCRAIVEAGLSSFYRYRTRPAGRAVDPLAATPVDTGVYDLPAVRRRFVSELDDGRQEAALALSGITCAACTWLIERRLGALPGVVGADVNFATHRARVRYDPSRVGLSTLLGAVNALGYRASPYDPASSEQQLEAERRRRLRELGLAGVLWVQIMMLALASYLGDWGDMEPAIRRLFDWAGLLLAIPVVTYCARPFMRAAWRDLRARSAGMDVPVSLAIGTAFAGSVWATVTGVGEVYYDSVAMFTFLLLLARFGEFLSRRSAAAGLTESLQSLPLLARLLDNDGRERTVAAATLAAGDRVVVRAGETVPADGVTVSGCSSVDEALLTGESRPRRKTSGDELIGGSVNIDSPLQMEVRSTGEDTVLSALIALAERARDGRPRLARIADRVASVFVLAVLCLAVLVAAWWWQHDPQRVLPVVVTLLVATCPCALSLATPTALVAGAGSLTRLGLVPVRADVIERLAAVDHVVLDKTGTLTRGRPRLVEMQTLGALGRGRCLALAAALESDSEHPLAVAVRDAAQRSETPACSVHDVVNEPGAGLRGRWHGQSVLLGNPDWVAGQCGLDGACQSWRDDPPEGFSATLLAVDGQPLALLRFVDAPREDAAELVAALAAAGVPVTLASGDGEAAVRHVAETLGIRDWRSAMRPREKLALVHRLQAEGRRVLMLGDGVNDLPVLSGADVSVAMPEAAQAARVRADAVLIDDRLAALPQALAVARRTLAVVRQNLAWAVLYNLMAVPLAAAGVLAPWMAAVGMSLSSLVVVGNALRARRTATAVGA